MVISFTVRSNDIKDLAHVCLNWHTPIPIWACRYHRGAEPCPKDKSSNINDLASIGSTPEGQWRMKACSGTGASPAQFFRAIFFRVPKNLGRALGEKAVDQLAESELGRLALRGELEPVLATAGADYARHWRGYIASLCAESL